MRFYVFLTFIWLLASCSFKQVFRLPAGEDDFVHVVLDIDWTIVAQIHEENPRISKTNLIQVGEETYRIKDWAREFVTALSKNPKVKISFFSGGGEPRNLELLSKIKLMDGSQRSFLDISDKVLSYHHLTEVPENLRTGERFSDRFKKDLSKLGFKEGKTIMVDDNYRFAVNEVQEKHFLWLGPTYNHYEIFKEVPTGSLTEEEARFVPKNMDQWLLGRNKLAVIWDVMDESIDDHFETGRPLHELVQAKAKQLDLSSGEVNEQLFESIDRGVNKLRRYGFQKGRVTRGDSCLLLIDSFL
ncbi:MAG: hypothetical protein EP326_13080 [Deltaproteobacteria bacterium]|nr:MAG: hypothetical protein EP326_13080 [Deltaproteobacteria bacterium]